MMRKFDEVPVPYEQYEEEYEGERAYGHRFRRTARRWVDRQRKQMLTRADRRRVSRAMKKKRI